VAQGEPVVVVEAMKMEHVVQASTAGVVDLRVGVGDRVERGDLLAVVRAVSDEAVWDEAVSDEAVSDEAVPDEAVPDAAVPDAAVSDAAETRAVG
jgi:pyruvate/2-oxoglutarate dehydrogenase complex dihydrolipoamide acyltransferase (E2) component